MTLEFTVQTQDAASTLQLVEEQLAQHGRSLTSQVAVVQVTCQVLRHLPHLAGPLQIPLAQEGDDVWEVLDRWKQQHHLTDRLTQHGFTVAEGMELEKHGLFRPQLHPVHGPLQERFEEHTGLAGLALLAQTTHGVHLVFPFGDSAPVVQAEVSIAHHQEECMGGTAGFWTAFQAHAKPVRYLREWQVMDARWLNVHHRPRPDVEHYAAVNHKSHLQVPVYLSVSETDTHLRLMLVLRDVRLRGKHNSVKLAATCRTRKVLLTFNKKTMRLYRMEGNSIRDVSYREALPERLSLGPLEAWEVFEGRIRQVLMDTVPHPDTRWLMQRSPLPDLIALATTPAVTHYAHLRSLTGPWGGPWAMEIRLPGKWLRPGRRKNGKWFKRQVFPHMDRRVLRKVTPQNVQFIHQLALLLGDPNAVLNVLESDVRNPWLNPGVLLGALKRGRTQTRLQGFRKAFLRSIRRQGLEDTLMEVNHMARQLELVLKKDPGFKLPDEVTCITRLHNLINRQASLHQGRQSKTPFRVLKCVQDRLNRHITVEGVTVDFQVALTEAELMDVGMDMNICVGGYAQLVRRGGRVIVVARQAGTPVFCVEVTGTEVTQFKMKHNQLPWGFHRQLAEQYLQAVKLRCTSDLHFIPQEEQHFVRLLQGKDLPRDSWSELLAA